MIPAVILAGGEGTRLRPLTESLPKALVPVQGKPFLQHQLERLRAAGIREVLLLVCYRGRQIEEYFAEGVRLGLRLAYSYEETPRGTAGALKLAESKLPDDFLLLNGDTLLAFDYAALVERYRRRGKLGVVVAFENRDTGLVSNLALGPDGRVVAYRRGNPAGLTHVDAGVAVCSRGILALVPPGRRVALEDEVYPLLIGRHELWAFPTRERFYDMGTPAGLAGLEAALGCEERSKRSGREEEWTQRARERIRESIRTKQELLAGGHIRLIAQVAEAMAAAYRKGGKVLLFGNGGSAADAQHIAAELLGRYYYDRPALPALALHANTSALTAIANDYSYAQVFARQVEAAVRSGDVAIGISTSGNSENVIEAVCAARARGAVTVALTGRSGGRLRELVDFCLAVPADDTPRIQEAHILIGHVLCELVEQELFPRPSESAREKLTIRVSAAEED